MRHYIEYQENFDINHLRILGLTVYVFLYKEEYELKTEKWKLWALQKKLVGFDKHIIYRIYIKKQEKVIRIKDFQIYKDNVPKKTTDLSTYKEALIFQGFLIKDDDNNDKISQSAALLLAPTNLDAKTKSLSYLVQPSITQAGRIVKPTKKSKHLKKTPSIPLLAENLQVLVIQLTDLVNLD